MPSIGDQRLKEFFTEARDIARNSASCFARIAADLVSAPRQHPVDFSVFVLMGSIGGALALFQFYSLNFTYLSSAFNFWFQADTPRLIESMLDRWSTMHYRASVHPLFPIFGALPVYILSRALELNDQTAIAAFVGGAAFTTTALFYWAARSIGLARLQSAALCLLLLSTGSGVFWIGIPETFVLGAATMLLPLIWLTAPRGAHDQVSAPLQSIVSLSITVTNWTAGLLATLLAFGPRKAIGPSIAAFACVAALTVVQGFVFPGVGRFLDLREESAWAGVEGNEVADRLLTFTQPILTSTPVVLDVDDRLLLGFDAYQLSAPLVVAVIGWLLIALLAGRTFLQGTLNPRASGFLLATVALQLLLHAVYGDGYFLYSFHFTPLVVLILGAALVGQHKRLALALVIVTTAVSAFHNLGNHKEATRLFNDRSRLVTEILAARHPRGEVLAAMAARPGDPWPLREGRSMWGASGAALEEKGYFEPAGSLTPYVGGPGLAIWAFGANGSLIATSDTIAAGDAAQAFVDYAADTVPAVAFQTPNYRAQWRQITPGRWRLDATPSGETASLALSVRGVGPASGAIYEIAADAGAGLVIDACWKVSVTGGELAFLGEDGATGWLGQRASVATSPFRSAAGWAAARLNAPGNAPLQAEIHNTCIAGSAPRWAYAGGASFEPAHLPIAGILTQQSNHLLMSLEGDQTRPGDPVYYPLQWQRDGAYVVVALLRAGRLDVTRTLVAQFATNDYFGGFGAEADAPGLGLWTLGEVARVVDDRAYDAELWPDVQRKAEMIIDLSNARTQTRATYTGPLTIDRTDTDVVAYGTVGGLIRGRMDWHEPLLYVNAVSWRGLVEAAEIADRLGETDDAARWRAAADELRAAWRQRFYFEGFSNERTAASLLWPTWIGGGDIDLIRRQLTAPPKLPAAPPWTYFDVARAHQHLLLDQPDAAWSQIETLMARSPLAGIGILWEGEAAHGPEFATTKWDRFRIGNGPAPVTPHYWSAAELLTFAVDSLAYAEEIEVPTIVIGSGILEAWLDEPLSARGVITTLGRVDWKWDGTRVTVALEDPSIPLRLGPAFPAGTKILLTSAGAGL